MTVMNAATSGGNVTLRGDAHAGRRADLRLEQREDLARAAADARLGDRAAHHQPQQPRGRLTWPTRSASSSSSPSTPTGSSSSRRSRTSPSLEVVGYARPPRRLARRSSSSQATSWSSLPTATTTTLTAMVDHAVKHRPDRPVVVMSEASPNGFLRQAFEAGADDVITLPQSPEAGRLHAAEGDRAAEGPRRSRQGDGAARRDPRAEGRHREDAHRDEPRGRARPARRERRPRRPRPPVRRHRARSRPLARADDVRPDEGRRRRSTTRSSTGI